ncbi:DUF1819 family protein [uncultured Clostridium sp.]|uniref:DUF1819 family protein n=1 Tax=uncultured Clostridium sp. TaxID=59620 RepID=UPI0026705D38|nr:DUF1819 family protein [uncultured Clostridium sp.]
MEYSAAMTSRPYLYKETKIVASLLANGTDITAIKKISVEENIFQLEKEYRRIEIAQAITSRLKNIDLLTIDKIANGSTEISKLLVVYIIMKHNRLFFEFINEVYREKIILRESTIKDKDFNIFFNRKREESEKVNGWSEYTFKKLKNVFTIILVDSGMGVKKNGEIEIKVPLIDKEISNHLIAIGDKVYINAMEGIA